MQIILAVYYTLADIVLLGQCFYYRGFTWRDEPPPPPKPAADAISGPTERSALLPHHHPDYHGERRGSDWTGLSPAVTHVSEMQVPRPAPTTLQTVVWNATIVVMVCAAGLLGWFLGQEATGGRHHAPRDSGDVIDFNVVGQVFGYLCAVAYIASRMPQLILNWRRKTTEGLSMLFFLFACLGNMTYILSIFAYEPTCPGRTCDPGEAGAIYGRYILVNLSWVAGSLLTLLMDIGVFVQYFMYRPDAAEPRPSAQAVPRGAEGEGPWDNRPLLQRGDSGHM